MRRMMVVVKSVPKRKSSVKKSPVHSALSKRRMVVRKASPKRSPKLLARPKKDEPQVAVMRLIVRKGYVRSPYMRKSGVMVKRAVVKSGQILKLGLPGRRHRVIPKLRKGFLSDLGYSAKALAKSRHEALEKAVKAYGALSVSKKLNAVYVLNRNTNPKVAKVFHDDRMYVAKKYLKH